MTTQYAQIENELSKSSRVWLITGVAGFIGSNLLRKLLSLGQMVVGLDNFETGKKDNIETVLAEFPEKLKSNFIFHEGSIRHLADCEKAMPGVDYVLHQAALGSVPRSIKTPEETHLTNTNGFLNILIAAKNANVKRVIYASSSSVYGDSPDLPKSEDKIGKPLSPYAVSKYSNELYSAAFTNCYQIETIGLRYFNVFGPQQDANSTYAAVIPQWMKAITENKTVYINGDGQTSRDFCYVDNVVQANILSATTNNQAAINTVYNIAVGEKNTLFQLYENILRVVKKPDHNNLVYKDFRQGDVLHSLANINKAKSLLGYSPSHNLLEGLTAMVNWYTTANKTW